MLCCVVVGAFLDLQNRNCEKKKMFSHPCFGFSDLFLRASCQDMDGVFLSIHPIHDDGKRTVFLRPKDEEMWLKQLTERRVSERENFEIVRQWKTPRWRH